MNINWDLLKISSEIFQSIGIGLGAFFGGLGGLIVFLDWWGKKRNEIKLKNLKRFYQRTNYKKDFILADEPANPGWIFLLDNRTKTRHWIKNPQTMRDLGYSYSDVDKTITAEKFKQYKESNEISTR